MPTYASISDTPVRLTPVGGSTGTITGASGSAITLIIDPLPQQIIGFNPLTGCSFEECRTFPGNCYINRAFGTIGAISPAYNNDFAGWFVQDDMTRGFVIRLQKLDIRLKVWSNAVTIGSTSTLLFPYSTSYGSFFNYGYFTGHPTYFGVNVNWGAVITLQGAGTYRLKVESPMTLNRTLPYCMISEPVDVQQFDCDRADSTVKFEANQSGKIGSHLSNGLVFDLCGINLYDSIRVEGIFGHKKGGYDKIEQEYQTGLIDQVRDENILKYQFMSELLPQWVHDRLMTYGMMATSLFVSDYCKNNSDYNIKMKRVVKDGGYEPEYNRLSRLASVKVDMKEGIQSIIKSTACDPVRQ